MKKKMEFGGFLKKMINIFIGTYIPYMKFCKDLDPIYIKLLYMEFSLGNKNPGCLKFLN